jgi:hypothetical protein
MMALVFPGRTLMAQSVILKGQGTVTTSPVTSAEASKESSSREAADDPRQSSKEEGKKSEPAKSENAATGVPPETSVSSGPVQRPTEPPVAPDKKELEVQPDGQGRVQFQFRHQAWPDVLQWLAEVSSMSLDWQELPGDYLNLATQRPYTLEETRDLINRHMLARGYTLLELDGVLQVSKTENINVALVPKVEPADLEQLPPHRFVRVSFSLDSLIAEEVIDEFKLLISLNGKLIPLPATNRFEAIDAVGNLRELHRILREEQSEATRADLAREFVLKHVRAGDVKTQLEAFLGIQKSSTSGSSDPNRQMQNIQEMLQKQQQMLQQRQDDRNASTDRRTQRPKEIYLVANTRQNSVIVHAQPDKMAIVEAFIRRVDVPNENTEDFQAMQTRMQVFRLTSLDPTQLVASLLAMDALEPTTQLEVDETNKAVIAHASLADQLVIQKVIERLDGSARSFELVQLRRLKADEVAGTIKFLLIGEKETQTDSSSSRRYYYDSSSQRNDDKSKLDDNFRVGANVADNQLLLWCNEFERKEVLNLLVKLGELPEEGTRPSQQRVIDATRSAETLEYLKALEEKWRRISPTPLILPREDTLEEPAPAAPRPPSKEIQPLSPPAAMPRAAMPPTAPADRGLDDEQPWKGRLVSTGDEAVSSESAKPPLSPAVSAQNAPAAGAAAIEIRFDSQGNLVLSSQDVEALDQLERLMLRDTPPQRPHEIIRLKNTRASWIKINLEDYFKDDLPSKNESRSTYYYFFDSRPNDTKKEDPQLGKRRQLRFIDDNDTNTIVVIGASPTQLAMIKELIELWDTPSPDKDKETRYQRLVPIRYSRAEAIEQAVKDAYRDFLSENDKAFDRNAEDGRKGGEAKRDPSAADRRFSLGVDSVTNVIIVSAEGKDLLEMICNIIAELDDAARPSGTMQVVPFETGGSSKSMEKAFESLLDASKRYSDYSERSRSQDNDRSKR